MNRLNQSPKKHDPFATRYIEITENKREESYRKFTYGPATLMKVSVIMVYSSPASSFNPTATR